MAFPAGELGAVPTQFVAGARRRSRRTGAPPGAPAFGSGRALSHKCWLCRLMALSWLNLPCALKAAIGNGKRTLSDPRQSGARRGPRQGPAASAFVRKRRREMLRLSLSVDDPAPT